MEGLNFKMLQLRHYYSYHLVYYRPSTFYQVESTSEGLIKLAQPFLRTSKSTSSGTHFRGYSQYSTYICRAGGIDPAAPVLARPVFSLVPRPLFSVFICGGGKKALVDLHRTFCSTDSQILGVVNRC